MTLYVTFLHLSIIFTATRAEGLMGPILRSIVALYVLTRGTRTEGLMGLRSIVAHTVYKTKDTRAVGVMGPRSI